MGSLGGISNTSANTLCLDIFLANLTLLIFETNTNDFRFLEFVAWGPWVGFLTPRQILCVLRFSQRPQGFSDFDHLISAWLVQFNRFPDQITDTYTFAKKSQLLFFSSLKMSAAERSGRRKPDV